MVQTLSECERLFNEEVREKKRTASGVHSKKGKNGYVGTMRFPSDIMNRKDKMRYRRGSKVMTTNMFDEILTISEFEQLDKNDQKNRLSYWRIENSNKEILKGMGISNKKYYDLVEELELPKAPRTPRKGTTTPAKKQKAQTPAIAEKTVPDAKEEESQVQEIVVNGLNVIFNGTYSAERIEKQLTKFMLLLDGEEEDFYIEMKLMQKQPK